MNKFCVRTHDELRMKLFRQVMKVMDHKVVFDNESNPVTCWVTTSLSLSEVRSMRVVVKDAIEATPTSAKPSVLFSVEVQGRREVREDSKYGKVVKTFRGEGRKAKAREYIAKYSATPTPDEVVKLVGRKLIDLDTAFRILSDENQKVHQAGGDCVAFREKYLSPLCRYGEVQEYAQRRDRAAYKEALKNADIDDSHEWAAYEVLSQDV